MAKARAFGKLILLGEHVVVYGAPALVAGIGLGVEAEARAGGAGQQLELLGRTRVADPSGDDLSRAFAALLADGGAPKALHVRASGNLPPGMGLGFSAAAGVAIARAVEGLNGDVDESRVRSRATAWETVFHGNPSGVDVAAAMRGGCTRFTKADGVSKVLVKEPLLLCVGLTGSGASTREMVEGVADLKRRKPELVERSIDGGAALVENAISAVEAGDHRALGELMNLNQMILAGLMVSNEKIETLVACARDSGALGAKLTGAGGGGAVVALAEDQSAADAIVAAWREIGYEGFCTEVGHP